MLKEQKDVGVGTPRFAAAPVTWEYQSSYHKLKNQLAPGYEIGGRLVVRTQ
jgi:hypothetical protein